MRTFIRLSGVVFCGLILAAACGGGDDSDGGGGAGGGSGGSPDNTGSVCEQASDCYPDLVDGGALSGEAQCLDRVRDGYCTHLCDADTDCCAAEGECKTTLAQVCSPFESTGLKMCFLSCEDTDITADGGAAMDPGAYCQKFASPDFICRSSGGGSQNRKICVPGDCGVGAGCTDDTGCATGLTCLTSVKGGYCGKADCTVNTDCPTDSLCVKVGDKSACYRTCNGDTDCSFCRAGDVVASCTDQVTFLESGTTGTVCVPPS
jgi:hypothetical protein